jgi:hypothetical protein
MKTLNTIPVMLALSVLFIPALTYASTYEYVNTSNGLQIVTANSAAEAFASASNIAPKSGVMLLSSTVGGSTSTYSLYEYVNTSGTLSTIRAQSSAQAIAEATNIAPNSGTITL